MIKLFKCDRILFIMYLCLIVFYQDGCQMQYATGADSLVVYDNI